MKTINVQKLSRELKDAGIQNAGCNSNGIVWDIDGHTEIQKEPSIKAIIDAHDPTPDPEPPSTTEQLLALREILEALVEVSNV